MIQPFCFIFFLFCFILSCISIYIYILCIVVSLKNYKPRIYVAAYLNIQSFLILIFTILESLSHFSDRIEADAVITNINACIHLFILNNPFTCLQLVNPQRFLVFNLFSFFAKVGKGEDTRVRILSLRTYN